MIAIVEAGAADSSASGCRRTSAPIDRPAQQECRGARLAAGAAADEGADPAILFDRGRRQQGLTAQQGGQGEDRLEQE
jgi:hypothetical protein